MECKCTDKTHSMNTPCTTTRYNIFFSSFVAPLTSFFISIDFQPMVLHSFHIFISFYFVVVVVVVAVIFLLLLNNKYALIFCLAGCKWKFPIINLHASDLLKTNGQFHCIGHKRKYFAAPVLLASHDFQLVGQFQCVSGIYFFLYFFLNFSLLVEP